MEVSFPDWSGYIEIDNNHKTDIALFENKFNWFITLDTWEEGNFKAIGVVEKRFFNFNSFLPRATAEKISRWQIKRAIKCANDDLKSRGSKIKIPNLKWDDKNNA